MKTGIRILLAIALIGALSACTSSHKQRMRPDIGYIQAPVETVPKPKYAGSLYEEQGSNSLLYVDRKAMQVNDIVTVLIVENARATGASNTTTDKSSTYSAEVSQLFGLPSSLGMSNFLGSGQPFQPKVAGSATAAFDGGGDTQRSNQLTATITARVVEVYPNATMRIVGGREVTINNDTQYIVLSGTIRREDISPLNIVRSDYIADARIEYYGEGVLADKNSPGWLARGLDWLWPF